MIIAVTQEHIDKGIKLSPKCCPLALALGSNGVVCPYVGSKFFYHGGFITKDPNPKKRLRVRLPDEVCTFISNFDAYRPVTPFSFEIEVA